VASECIVGGQSIKKVRTFGLDRLREMFSLTKEDEEWSRVNCKISLIVGKQRKRNMR
jgi:hypothetical protein